MNEIKDLIEAQYDEYLTMFESDKYLWAASEVFNLTTYDDFLDEVFVKDIVDIVDVLKAILKRETFEYIRDGRNYMKYIWICQLLNEFNWISWGTSIRGAWFENNPMAPARDIVVREWSRGRIKPVPFTEKNIAAFIEFMEED